MKIREMTPEQASALRARCMALFNADFERGVLTRATSIQGARADGSVGTVRRGYLKVCVDGRTYAVHHLLWLMAVGHWPADELDHIDRDRTNNALSNLRPATGALNNRNRPTTSASGYRGAYRYHDPRYAEPRWKAEAWLHNKRHPLGAFRSAEEAARAYDRFILDNGLEAWSPLNFPADQRQAAA